MITWRQARRDDVPAIIALLADDALGAAREGETPSAYFAAFEAIQAESGNSLIVGEQEGAIVATYQLTFITGLSRRASRRAQVESVRVQDDLRSRGIGAELMRDAEARARAAGCTLIQLTSDKTRARAQSFYLTMGYNPSHTGFKKPLV
ncbi:GNAT family N-acetyltransferase [Pseudorhodobacter sp.]|uniref:GNAT family N-acetyltransferase n=1 Tax=Pseudorhodobacter sp. TaxID=1934400 RepID=UPI0026483DD5|nr:GNAT family N-acetyltransferase [Pseudorhodobacter sp.]MDN5785990.1 GNAT family N-acetyltransferase [Pseudorhodobacter sp.]